MPLIVNRHGIVNCVNEDQLQSGLDHRGWRLLDDDDWNYAQTTPEVFEAQAVQGFDRHALGTRPVLVRGAGPSQTADVEGAFTIAVNARPFCPESDAVLALDNVYWVSGMWRAYHEKNPGGLQFYPKGFAGPPEAYDDGRAFTLPIYPVKQREWSTIAIRVEDVICHCHFSSVAALTVARFLTQGPIILTGMDMGDKYVDQAGDRYDKRQTLAWEKISEVVRDTYIHPDVVGPLADLFPTWEADNG